MKRVSLGLTFLLLAACPPDSEKPLTPPQKAVVDRALLGVWENDDGLEVSLSVKTGGVLSIDVSDNGRKKEEFQAHTSIIDGAQYLNLQVVENGAVLPGFLFARYVVTGTGELEVRIIAEEPVLRASEAGTLKTKKAGGSMGGVSITDTPAKIVAFIKAQKSDELWEKFATFKRSRAR